MTPKANEFFVELAQLCKKYQTIGYGKLPLSLVSEYLDHYKVTEIWITKEGEAVVRINNGEYDIYSG